MSLAYTQPPLSLADLALFGPPSPAANSRAPVVWTWRIALACHAAIIALVSMAGAVWLLTDSVVPWDSKNQFYPFFRFLADSLARGDFPLWNPYHFGGHPAIADPQSLIFTPTMGVLALILPQASMQAFDAFILAHLAAGGMGVLGLFRRRGWHPAGALLAATVFMLASSPSARLQHTGMIISYSLFPLALWALEAALQKVSYRIGVLFALVAALMALGRDQVAFLCCGGLLLAAVWPMFTAANPLAWLRRRWLLLIVMAAVGAATMFVPVLLTLQFLGSSNRPGISYGVAATGSLTPVNLVTLLIPNIFGALDWNYDYWGPGYETTQEPNWTDRSINYLFIGTIPAVLALWRGLACGQLFSRGARYFAVLTFVAGLYALGRYTPVFGVIFDHLPGVALYRRPADATFLLNIGLAYGCGYVLHLYVTPATARPAWKWRRWLDYPWMALVAAAIAVTVLAALQLSQAGGHFVEALWATIGAGVLSSLVILAFSLARDTAQRSVIAFCAVLATMGELVGRDAASSLNAEPKSAYSVYGQMKPIEAAALAALRADMAARDDFPRVEILGLGGPWQNASITLELEDTLGYNPLRISAYERAVGPGENAGDPNLRQFPGLFRGYRSKLASLLGLKYLILDRPLAKLPRRFPRPLATLIFSGERFYVYRLSNPAPRAYMATQIISIDSDGAIDDAQMPEFDRSHQALIDQADMPRIGAEVTRGDSNPAIDPHVHIVAHHADDVVIEVDCDRPGVVVLHDLYYPGWVARVDGQQAPILRANILFRGVEVASGHHIVEFSFEPLTLANLTQAALNLIRRNEE